MATELTVQSERAFQKQPHIFLNSKVKSKSKSVGKGGRRWYKDVGLGFRTPKTAIEGSYIGMEAEFTFSPARHLAANIAKRFCIIAKTTIREPDGDFMTRGKI